MNAAPMPSPRASFLVTAPDQPGLVARLAGFFHRLGLNIVDSTHHSEPARADAPARFFMRIVVDLEALAGPAAQAALDGSPTRQALESAFAALAAELSATHSVGFSDRIARVALMVTRDPATFYDLVLRQKNGELPCELACVISNHAHLEEAAASFRLPFFHLPITPDTRRDQETRVLDLLRRHHVDLVVLARYMQILTGEFLGAAPPVINIHHGFLPAFQGAKPYHQAYARGVKLIGATAHYATQDLDQGPIIEQDVARVTHQADPEEMVRIGRDVERLVLSRAVRAHLERRVVVDGARTIIL